jgi:periplasmic divalent cation tolerance protein
MKNPILISTSFEDREQAEKLLAILLQERLVACGQISGPVTSSYWWQGSITTAAEFVLSVKTIMGHYDSVESAIQINHPYEVPEIIAVAITHISDDYRDWMLQELEA